MQDHTTDDSTDDVPHCALCGDRVNPDTDDYLGIVEDSGALYSGYDMRNDDTQDIDQVYTCRGCTETLADAGDLYTIIAPSHPDAPETGGLWRSQAVVDGTIITDVGGRPPHGFDCEVETAEIEHGGFAYRLVRAYVFDNPLPTDCLEQYADLSDGAGWEQIGTGWHSSMERSAVSDRINAIQQGSVGVTAPVLVKYGETRNVCSTSVTIYAPEGTRVYSPDQHKMVSVRDYLREKNHGRAFGFATN